MSASVLGVLGESSIRSALLVMVVAVILTMLRVRDASAKHAVLTAAMCTMMLMPALLHAVPALDISRPAFISSVQIARDVDANLPRAMDRTRAVAESQTADVRPDATRQRKSSTATPIPLDPWRAKTFWPQVALSLYIAVALLLSLRFVFGWRKATRIARHALPVDIRCDLRLFRTAERVAICESAQS